MSQTKYVSYSEQGFWVYDVALGVFLKHLIDAAKASAPTNTGWLSSAVSDWREAACIQDWGLTLDSDAPWSAEERQTFVVLADEACTMLAKRTSIPAEEIVRWQILDDFHIFPRGATNVLTAPVVELGRAMIALVSGDLPEAPEGNAWLYGTETGRQTLQSRG